MAVEEANLWRSPARMPRILVAEDEPEMRRVLAWALQREGYRVVEAANGTDLLACVEQRCPVPEIRYSRVEFLFEAPVWWDCRC
jgi:PleD family two-component response regulator